MVSEYTMCTIPESRAMVDRKAASSVKRCLFGEPNHAHVRSELVKQLALIIKQDSEKYNFDFVSGQPLTGPFQWEKFNRTPVADEEIKEKSTERSVPEALERLQLTTADTTTEEKKTKQSCLTKTKSTKFGSKPHRKQLKLTGLFPQKKRTSLPGEPVKALKRCLSETDAVHEKVVMPKRRCCQRS